MLSTPQRRMIGLCGRGLRMMQAANARGGRLSARGVESSRLAAGVLDEGQVLVCVRVRRGGKGEACVRL
jgi:hypothetical protein